MKLHHVLVAALAALPLAAFHPGSASLRAADDSELHRQMEGLQAGMRQVGRSIADAEKHPDALVTVAAMRGHVLAAFELAPAAPEGVDPARHALEFRLELHGVLGELLALERALLDRDPAAARERFAALNARKKTGHDRFRVGE